MDMFVYHICISIPYFTIFNELNNTHGIRVRHFRKKDITRAQVSLQFIKLLNLPFVVVLDFLHLVLFLPVSSLLYSPL